MELLSTKMVRTVEDIQQLEQEFYSRDFFFSYSSMNRLLWNPASFYQQYILKKKEEKLDKHLLEGKVIHALLLSKDIFSQLFVVMPSKLPTENTKLLLDKLFKQYYVADLQKGQQKDSLFEYQTQIMQLLKEMDLHQALKDDKPDKSMKIEKTGDDKRMDKITTDDALDYWEYLKIKGSRDVIDQATLDFCNQAVDKVKSNPRIMELLGAYVTEFSENVVLNEQEFSYKLANWPFGLKGILDNLHIHYERKVIYINDLKTNGKELKDFHESIDYYNYWIQVVIYVMLVLHQYPHLIEDGFRIEFRFIVIDRNHNVYPFRVSEATMEKWFTKFKTECLFKANYHYTQKQYSLPYEFAEELIVL